MFGVFSVYSGFFPSVDPLLPFFCTKREALYKRKSRSMAGLSCLSGGNCTNLMHCTKTEERHRIFVRRLPVDGATQRCEQGRTGWSQQSCSTGCAPSTPVRISKKLPALLGVQKQQAPRTRTRTL